MKTKSLTALLCVFITGTQIAAAEVCLEKGIYVANRVDLPGINGQPSFFSLPLKRIYNSSFSVPGMFGSGWVTSYSTTLKVTGNGVIVIQEGGTGKKSFYTSDKAPNNPDDTVKQTFAPLQDDCSFSANISPQDFNLFGENSKTKAGGIFNWRLGCVRGYVKKDTDGFQRIRSGMSEIFDSKGRLYKATNNKGAEVVIHRNNQNQITQISNNKGSFLAFEYSLDGLVTSATRGDKKVSYIYQGKNLILAEVGDDKHQYTYNEEGLLVQIVANETILENITYNTKGRITFLEDDGNRLEVFQYLDHDSTLLKNGYAHGSIKTVYRNKQLSWQDINFYARKTNKYDISHLSHRLGEIRGIQHETIYQECGLPVTYSSGKSRTSYQYNKDCLLVVQDDGKTIKKLSYDEKHQKISKVTTTDIRSNQTTWSRFTYDSKGNLVHGKTSENLETHLDYGPDNQIASMKNEKGQVVSFQYNDAGKPTLIEMADIGRLDISYDEYGEVSSVTPGEGNGHEVATMLTDVVQKLLRIVKPAGIDMGM